MFGHGGRARLIQPQNVIVVSVGFSETHYHTDNTINIDR